MKTFDDSSLLPCPFCGSKAETYIDFANETAYARCTNYKCRACTGRLLMGSREDAQNLWNRRVDTNFHPYGELLTEEEGK